MEFLYKDSRGNIPVSSQRSISRDDWVSPNTDCSTIPLEAMEHRAKPQDAMPDNIGIGPNGTFLEMDWVLKPVWYNHKFHWEAWIPTGPTLPDPLQFSFPQILEEHPDYLMDPYHANDLIDILLEFWNAIAAIINIRPYQDGNISPHPFNWNQLREKYMSPENVIRVQADTIRATLSYGGFVVWWATSIHDWSSDLTELTIYKIQQIINKCGTQRRGVLVDLAQDWREVGIAHWIANDIPVYYVWDNRLANTNRFLWLSPSILSTAIASMLNYDNQDIVMAGTGISDDEKETLALYDEFLQEIELPDNHTSNPLTAADEFSIYWIVDFCGWECRPLDTVAVAREYSRCYHWGNECGSIQRFTVWRFRPRYTSALILRAGIKHSGIAINCQQSDREIRELFKGALAPRPGERFNLEGWRLSSSVMYDEPIPARIADCQVTKHCEPPRNTTRHPDHVSLLAHMLPREQSTPRPSSRTSTPASNSGDNSPHTPSYMACWVEDMAKIGQSTLQSSSRTTPEERGHRWGRRFANLDPTFSRPGDRSASPRPSLQQSIGAKEVLRELLVCGLRHKGLPLVQKCPTWSLSKDMNWNPLLLQYGILMFWDLESQVCMRYWSLCTTGISTISQILECAILHGVCFAIGVQAKDIEIF